MAGEPDDLLFYATYDSSTTADYSKNGYPVPDFIDGVLTISTTDKQCGAGSLEIDGADYKSFATYRPQTALGQQGSIVLYHYMSSSLSDAGIITSWKDGGFSASVLFLICDPNSTEITFDIYDGQAPFGSFVAGVQHSSAPVNTWYHLECNYDFDSGDIYMFVDGTLVESDTFSPTTMGSGVEEYTIGHRTRFSGFNRIDDLQVWDSVQHTANFSPACGLPSAGPASHPYLSFGPRNFLARGFAK